MGGPGDGVGVPDSGSAVPRGYKSDIVPCIMPQSTTEDKRNVSLTNATVPPRLTNELLRHAPLSGNAAAYGGKPQRRHGERLYRCLLSAEKIKQNLVKLLGVLHEHEMAATLRFIKNMNLSVGNLACNPLLRARIKDTFLTAKHDCGHSDPHDHVPPILAAMVDEERGRRFARKFQVLLDYPIELLGREGFGEESVFDQILRLFHSVRSGQSRCLVVKRLRSEYGSGNSLLVVRPSGPRHHSGSLINDDHAGKSIGAKMIPIAPDHGRTERMPA